MKKIIILSLFLTSIFQSTSLSFASEFEAGEMYFGISGKKASLTDLARYTPQGSTIMIGEYHDNVAHHDHQVALIQALIDAGHTVALGMEFLQTPYQSDVNEFLEGDVNEEDFLKKINWGNNDFNLYREQIALANESSHTVLAINAPSALTSRVSKVGIDALTGDEKSQLPPDFTLGNDEYFERFKDAMGGHVSEEKIARYFQAQSIWDDTMAWNIAESRKKLALLGEKKTTLVVIVGDFHVRHFGGTPDRVTKRTGMSPVVISQMNMNELSDEEIKSEILPDEDYGARADFVWTSNE